MLLAKEVVRWRIVSVISLIVAAFAMMTAMGADHAAKQAQRRADAAYQTLEAAERYHTAQRNLLMHQIDAFLKSLDRSRAPSPRQAKKV
jgi:uncharacterized membrane protein